MSDFLSTILGTLVEKLASSAVREIQLVWGIEDDREELKKKLVMIQTVLADAEQKQTKDEAVRIWLLKLKDFCYDADYVLDKFEDKALLRRARSTKHLTFKRKVCYKSLRISNFIFQFKMAHNMKKLRKRLDRIYEEKTKFSLSSNVEAKTIVLPRETHSFISHLSVIGRNSEKESIIKQLIGPDDGGAGTIAVVPIIGMGGTGKTAIAAFAYNDVRVKEHFDHRVWIFMPKYEVRKVIGDIIESLGSREKCNTLDMLQKCLRSIVENKRCLFVMDDVWELRKEDWDELTELLGCVSKGSRVIVTSRHSWIANTMSTAPQLKLGDLSDEDCLKLFMKCAFHQGQEKNHQELMGVGKQIVTKCWGNPLAVRSLGSLLCTNYDLSYWEDVRDSEMWQLPTEILPSLRISYNSMPHHLQKCFALCSIFPKNHKFTDFNLITLWMSNGIIQPTGNNQELEEIGRQYVEELCSRSFFDVVKEDHPLLTLRMHDLIHELAVSVAQTESSNLEERGQDVSPKTRHISLLHPSCVPKDELDGYLSKLSRVSTVVLGNVSAREFLLEKCIRAFKGLRVLWLGEANFDLLPSSIGSLKYLRCLLIGLNRGMKKLPGWICDLCNLQCLGLEGCVGLEELPANIKKMSSLRVLTITTKQQHFPEGGIGCLTSLRWLYINECENLEALFDDIQSLASLHRLFVVGCPKLTSLPQGIKNLKALKDLWIADCERLRLPEGKSNELRLHSLRFEGLPEVDFLPRWLEGSASTLRRIKIVNCPNLRELPKWLRNCPCLKKLEIKSCPRLSSLPAGISTSTMVKISDCGELSSRAGEGDY